MTPIEALSKLLSEQDVSQQQREALVDLIVWTMYVDGSIRYEENEQLDEVVDRLTFSAAFPLTSYLYTSIARFRDVWHDAEHAEAVLDEITERLADDELRQTAYALSESVARADGELADAEQAFLARVRGHFGIEE